MLKKTVSPPEEESERAVAEEENEPGKATPGASAGEFERCW